MAARHIINIPVIHKLMLHSSKVCYFRQGLCLNGQYYLRTSCLPFQAPIPSQTRNLHLFHHLQKADNGPKNFTANQTSGSQTNKSGPQTNSFSVLNYIKKSIPLSLKLDVPIGSFSTGTAKEIRKNLGNFTSSKTRFLEFFSLREFLSTPAPFMLYGIGGLIPFLSVPVYMQMTSSYSLSLAHAQLVYGACILSFLGGVSWGFELLKARNATFKSLSYSIFLPLIAWSGVLMHPNVAAFPIMISGVALASYVDTHFQSFPLWFKNLRFWLSTLVVLSLFSTFIFRFTKTKSDLISDKNNVIVSVD